MIFKDGQRKLKNVYQMILVTILSLCKCCINFNVLAVPQDQPTSWQENYVCLLDAASIIRLRASIIHCISVLAHAPFRSALQNCSDVLSNNVQLLLNHLLKYANRKLWYTHVYHGVCDFYFDNT